LKELFWIGSIQLIHDFPKAERCREM
jgi:hypothetical protein